MALFELELSERFVKGNAIHYIAEPTLVLVCDQNKHLNDKKGESQVLNRGTVLGNNTKMTQG